MPSGATPGTLYLVDAHSLIFQVFHAIRGMNSPSGLPTNALFGFTRDLLFLRKRRPTYLLCAFDRSEPTFRSDVDPAYKANRAAMPDDLQMQLPLIHQVLEALSIPSVSVAGFEADDVMATIATAASAQGIDVFLCTSDKDCRQLIDDHVRLYNLRKHHEFGRAELNADWGITPEQVVDLQTLVGDSVDNVKGVPGIGIKTAARLLQEFGTLENILANIDRVPGASKQKALRESESILPSTRKLVRLVTDVPMEMRWDAWRLHDIDVPRMLALCQEWGFHSLAAQIRSESAADGAAARPVQAELFPAGEEAFPFGANAPAVGPASRAGPAEVPLGSRHLPEAGPAEVPLGSRHLPGAAPAEVPLGSRHLPGAAPAEVPLGSRNLHDAWPHTYHLVDTEAAFTSFHKELRKHKRFAVDTETTSLQPLEADVVGLSFAWKEGEAWYLAVRGPDGARVLGPAILERLRPLLEDARVAKVNQNIKYDLLVLRGHGIRVAGVAGDPMVGDYLLHAGERSHNLEELARRYLNHQVIPITDLIGKKTRKQPQLRMDQVSTERVAEYAGEDADVALRLTERIEEQLARVEDDRARAADETAPPRSTLRHLYDELEVPLIEVLAEMEYNGIRLDVPLLRKLSAEMEEQLKTIEQQIYELAGHPFNIGSLVQLRKVLFDELKLPVQGKTGITGAASTDQESLEKLAALNLPGSELPRKILEHRQIAKLKSTYVDALPDMVNPRTGRIHASFNQTVTVTGRLSASDPNLQNVPVRREQGQQIRAAFLPQEGWLLLTADYSQIELRLLAHFCGDAELRRAFAEGRDVHAAVAAQIYGVPENEVTPAQRRLAKTVNFGVIYGISAPGLAQRLGISRDEGVKFIKAYFAKYPKVEEYQARLLNECRRTGYVATILGRRRYFDPQAIRPGSTYQQRNQAEREAINMEVQGSAADLIKLAMLHVYRRLQREQRQARLLLQIHDELVFEVPPAERQAVAELVREEMAAGVAERLKLEVPLEVDLAIGPNWLDVETM